MKRVISVSNQKGGVGKTTTSVNLAASLAKTKQNVLLIDLDPQGNATMGSGVDKLNTAVTINDVLMGRKKIEDAITLTEAGFDVVASNSDLTESEVGLLQKRDRDTVLKKSIDRLTDYDFIIIDCPPALNSLTLNALVASDSVLIPMQCEYYALEGLVGLINTVEQIKTNLNPDLCIEGVVRTMYDGRSKLSSEVSKQLIEHFGDKVYRTVIPRNIRLAEAPSHGLPVLLYDKRSPGASAYMVLAAEVLKRARDKQNKTVVEEVA